MNKFYIATCVFVFLCVGFAGCKKEIDLEYHDIPAMPVIEGVLSDEGAKVSVTLTTPMDEPMDNTPLTDAKVMITNMASGESVDLLPDEDGIYVSSAVGIPGEEYRLEVERNGESYTMSTMMFAPVDIESARFEWISMPYDEVAVLQVRYYDNPEISGECYWVRVYRNGEIYMWQEQSDRTSSDGIMTFTAMTTRHDTDEEDEKDLINDGDVITVTVSPITKAMHDYLEAIGNNSSGPRLFTSVPESPGCLGYFMATTTSSTSLIFHR